MSLHSLELSEVCEMVTGFPLEKIVVFDTETTGIDTSNDEVLSLTKAYQIADGLGVRAQTFLDLMHGEE